MIQASPAPAAGRGGGAPAPTADQVVGQLASRVPTATAGQAITAESDPNHLLSRPGQYTSAAMFTDSRVPADQRDPNPTSVQNGGKVEVFASEEAQQRMDYIQGLARTTPLAAEYDYLSRTALVRVSRTLTPA